ncbi:MAG: NFACT family protein [Armatimonadetes bacterium]|nr:NFACT family protein [Armatimonadota bacterium]
MIFDALTLYAVVEELKAVEGHLVSDVYQPTETEVVLHFRAAGSHRMFLLSAHPQLARAHFTERKIPNPAVPPNFCMLLRKHLEGTRLEGAVQEGPFDRILSLTFARRNDFPRRLVAEMMGRHSNIILLDDEEKILGAAKNITHRINRYREVLPGRAYVRPPGGDKANPLQVSQAEFLRWAEKVPAGTPLARWLMDTFNGMGTFIAREIAVRSGAENVRSDPAGCWEAFWSVFRAARQGFEPVVIEGEEGRSVSCWVLPSVQHPAQRQRRTETASQALDEAGWEVSHRVRTGQIRQELASEIAEEAGWREQNSRQLEHAIEEGNRAESYRQMGDLVLAGLGRIERGAASWKTMNYYDPEMAEVTIELDPKLGPKENAQRYFDRARKAREGALVAAERLVKNKEETALFQEAARSLEAAEGDEAIRQIRRRLVEAGLLPPQEERLPSRKMKEKDPFAGHKIRQFTTADGWEILVGENNQANDFLTTKYAAPDDLWLHVRMAPSAHGIIRTQKRPDAIPPHVIEEAARLVARHSDSKHAALVPVDYALRRFVRKPKGSPPGKVIYQNEKTVFVETALNP